MVRTFPIQVLRTSGTIALLVLASAPVPVWAQEGPAVVDLAAGYQYMVDVPAEEDFRTGWSASAAWNATNWLALAAEFSHSQKMANAAGGRLDADVYSTLGGVRFGTRGVFGQVLFGQIAVRARQQQLLGTLDETITDSAIQPGFGFTIGSSRVAARIVVSYLSVLSGQADFGRQLRVVTGVTVGLGRR